MVTDRVLLTGGGRWQNTSSTVHAGQIETQPRMSIDWLDNHAIGSNLAVKCRSSWGA
jgi:hypothetical protein